MIELKDVAYCRLGTRDLAGAEWFAVNILGLEISEHRKDAIYFKSDAREHTLCYFEGSPDDQVTAFEIATSDDLERAATALDSLGYKVHEGKVPECEARHVRAFIGFVDPTGNSIELVVRPAISGCRYYGTRDAGITGFSHVGLCTTDPARDETFAMRASLTALARLLYFGLARFTTRLHSFRFTRQAFSTSTTKWNAPTTSSARSISSAKTGSTSASDPGVTQHPRRSSCTSPALME
jgi:catechol 2,3-dioxygenase-like lactoylglutathione lyase family enzyme